MALRALEFLPLFFAPPALFAYTRHRIPAIPAWWVLAAWCSLVLLRDPGFDRARLWNAAEFPHYAGAILSLFAGVALIGAALVRPLAQPDLFLNFLRSNPRLWGLLMLLPLHALGTSQAISMREKAAPCGRLLRNGTESAL